MTPAFTYSEISREVDALITRHAQNSRASVAGLVARAALLQVLVEQGPRVAAEKAYALGDELATAGQGR